MKFRLAAGWLALIAAAAMAAPQESLSTPDGVVLVTPPRAIADFALTDQDGRAFRFSQLQGRQALLFFGFAHCPDVCPAMLFKLAQLEKSAPRDLAAVRVLMVSVDGDRDTPQVLKSYLARFSPRFIGLTGEPRAVADIAAQFPAVFFKGLPPAPGGNYSVQHTSAVYAIDREGRVRAQFTDATVESMIAVLRALR